MDSLNPHQRIGYTPVDASGLASLIPFFVKSVYSVHSVVMLSKRVTTAYTESTEQSGESTSLFQLNGHEKREKIFRFPL